MIIVKHSKKIFNISFQNAAKYRKLTCACPIHTDTHYNGNTYIHAYTLSHIHTDTHKHTHTHIHT